ncbi:MAG: type IV pili methyl-accepting chemotaxis transducer N-terminal domain-containing protein [Nitrospira sp.]|nr:type IV pili methyl-accepting chemotaxis transducer N-terminal domain-containing protein [Nitrospira sp.]
MSDTTRQWSLGAKLALVGLPFLLLGLLTSALTLWVSSQLDGAAAAVNEAGRLRMQTVRIAWLAGRVEPAVLDAQVAAFDASLALLRNGAPERPLVVPWDDTVRARFAAVEAGWHAYRSQWPRGAAPAAIAAQEAATVDLVARIDALVHATEAHLARYTSLMHLLQLGLLMLGVIGAAVLVVTGYRFVVEPVVVLKQAIDRLHAGDLGVRVAIASRDEFGALADGFNDMAGKLQALYRNLEARVNEKTAELKDQRERLRTLYEVSTLVTHSSALAELAAGFVGQVRHAVHADAAALRWADDDSERFVMLASDGVPDALARDEHCIRSGDCHCGIAPGQQGARVIPMHALAGDGPLGCRHAGWSTVVTVPIRLKERLLGELDLFFHARYRLGDAERTLLDALTAHLASGIENLRVVALEKEAAVAQERGFIARELHDSIAQSLAFLKIQVQLMRDAMERGDRTAMAAVLAEIDLGVKESHGNVRELLLSFRTRTDPEDIEGALRTTLRKFEQQTGVPAELTLHGQGLPLAPDVQVQALHIVQEALSNVRKHAGASGVRLQVWRQPVWRFEVHDDGVGFDTRRDDRSETHVGLRIMAERAERLGARFSVESSPGRGTRVRLTLPPIVAASTAVATADATAAATADTAAIATVASPDATTH